MTHLADQLSQGEGPVEKPLPVCTSMALPYGPAGRSPEPLPRGLGHPVPGPPPVQVARTHIISQLL